MYICLKLEKNLDTKKIFMGIKDKFTYYYKVMAMATRATYIHKLQTFLVWFKVQMEWIFVLGTRISSRWDFNFLKFIGNYLQFIKIEQKRIEASNTNNYALQTAMKYTIIL